MSAASQRLFIGLDVAPVVCFVPTREGLAFVAYCYGKPPEKLAVNELEPRTTLRLYFAHQFDKKFGDTAVQARILPDRTSNGEGTLRPLAT